MIISRVYFAGFEVLTMVAMKSSLFCDKTLRSLVKVNQYFRGTYHRCLQGWIVSQETNQHEAGSKQRTVHVACFMLISSSAFFLALKVEAICSSKTMNYFHQTKGHMSKNNFSKCILYNLLGRPRRRREDNIKMDLIMRWMVVPRHYTSVLAMLKLRVLLSQCLLVNCVPYGRLMIVYETLILTFLSISIMWKSVACKLCLLSLGLLFWPFSSTAITTGVNSLQYTLW
jgi:hypothetical protein